MGLSLITQFYRSDATSAYPANLEASSKSRIVLLLDYSGSWSSTMQAIVTQIGFCTPKLTLSETELLYSVQADRKSW
jgi:hypothetical protein